MQNKKILITGGAGFIGSHLVKYMVDTYPTYEIHVIDNLTYAGNKKNLDGYVEKITFHQMDISESRIMKIFLEINKFEGIINCAAETHVDNSIGDPQIFIKTNVVGTLNLIEACVKYSSRFLQVSTDEVYGSLDFNDGRTFYEFTPFAPQSPYAASKAAADLLILSFINTYDLNGVISHSSNNFGCNQHPEKLIPKVITCLKNYEQIPIYGNGENIRDWIHVSDHVRALDKIFHHGKKGERYNVGASMALTNLSLVKKICNVYDGLKGAPLGTSSRLINFVDDRLSHDLRYEINYDKISTKLRWKPKVNFILGLNETIKSYI
jgi:dTDP-glucose 4,6-dehydratase